MCTHNVTDACKTKLQAIWGKERHRLILHNDISSCITELSIFTDDTKEVNHSFSLILWVRHVAFPVQQMTFWFLDLTHKVWNLIWLAFQTIYECVLNLICLNQFPWDFFWPSRIDTSTRLIPVWMYPKLDFACLLELSLTLILPKQLRGNRGKRQREGEILENELQTYPKQNCFCLIAN